MVAALIFLLVFCGGFSIMAIELLGGRILAPYFGSSIYVWGSLITVFMLALAAGGARAGEKVDLELVLLADASGSIDDAEILFQRQGYAAAITDPTRYQPA